MVHVGLILPKNLLPALVKSSDQTLGVCLIQSCSLNMVGYTHLFAIYTCVVNALIGKELAGLYKNLVH